MLFYSPYYKPYQTYSHFYLNSVLYPVSYPHVMCHNIPILILILLSIAWYKVKIVLSNFKIERYFYYSAIILSNNVIILAFLYLPLLSNPLITHNILI